MKIERALLKVEERQADCFSHVHASSMRYLIVLQGVISNEVAEPEAAMMARGQGRISSTTKESLYMSRCEPKLMPGEHGPLTILLVL